MAKKGYGAQVIIPDNIFTVFFYLSILYLKLK